MIENYLIEHIEANTETPVYVFVPEVMPNEFFVIDRTGTARDNHIETVTVAIQSYARTAERAAELIEEMVEIMDTLTDGPGVSACRLDNVYMFTDTTRNRPRYQAVFDITHYNV